MNRRLTYTALVLLAAVFLLPVAWNVLFSLKSASEAASVNGHILPQHTQWSTYKQALTLIDFKRYLWNTLLLAVPYATLITLTSALVGFGFARLRARGRSGLFLLMLATSMIPQILTVIPTYVLFSRVHLVNTRWPWILWGLAASPFLTFLFRQYFATLPAELEDAAILDGCGWLRIFAQIFLPLSKPVLATSFIVSFTWVWGDFFTPEIFLSDAKTTLGVAMSNGYTDPVTSAPLTNVLAAGTMFYVIPVLVVFFIAQRAFVRGIATTGLKG
jgi:ABC-type glycerol-3-phosphate transport system permease component